MFYPNEMSYSKMKMEEEEEDALDLCVRKRDEGEQTEKFAGDVNGNGYGENSNGFYKSDFQCKTPEPLMQERRYVPSMLTPSDPGSSPTGVILNDKLYPGGECVSRGPGTYSNNVNNFSVPCTERVQTSPGSNNNQFSLDNHGSRYIPLPMSISSNLTRNGKPTRPFKAYPKDFLALATSEGLLDDSSKRYMEFRRQFLTQLHASSTVTSNKNMKRPVQSDSPNQLPSSSGDAKDQAYWERRKKNNEAAKKSRDARRAKEDEIAIRAAFLERENVRLKLELASLRNETERLRCMLYS